MTDREHDGQLDIDADAGDDDDGGFDELDADLAAAAFRFQPTEQPAKLMLYIR